MRKRVEAMLIEGHRSGQVISLLEDLAGAADEGTEMALFAHRQLAELCLEGSPWKAALHLRRLLLSGAADDGVHALLGLCHALLGNFRSAVAAYRGALRVAPNNPWYHHNLGHLLDVGLSKPAAALPHLRKAHELGPREDEVTASLAHCLARLGRFDEALSLARRARNAAPHNPEHRALLEWIEQGAPEGQGPPGQGQTGAETGGMHGGGTRVPGLPSGWPPVAHAARPGHIVDDDLGRVSGRLEDGRGAALDDLSDDHFDDELARGRAGQRDSGPGLLASDPVGRAHRAARDDTHDEVAALLSDSMGDRGRPPEDLRRAKAVWRDYRRARQPRVAKPGVFAAAVEYAAAKASGVAGVTQAALAARYGVGSRSVSQRYVEIRDVLGIVPHDPRYAP